MNPRTHSDIMLPAFDLDPVTGQSSSGHPYGYARILGVFHVTVSHRLPGHYPTVHTMEVLLVRWYRLVTSYRAGFNARRLYRLEFLSETLADPDAFGFLNPDDVIRGAHLIPAYAHGRITDESLYYSDTWRYYYVNL